MLADDSVTIQKVVNLTFADEGVDVVVAGNGDLAMQMIAEQRPDIVLADVNMPGLNGYQICERLRHSDETKDIPVLLLVGSFEPFDEDEAKRVGASGFMTKPFQSIRLLVSQVSELLEKSDQTVGSAPKGDLIDEPAGDELLSAPRPDEPQTADIEDLYNQSFASTVEILNVEGDNSDKFADAGMDDEIIETTYVSGDSAKTEDMSPDNFPDSSPFEERVSHESEHPRTEPDAIESVTDLEGSDVRPSDEFNEPASGSAFDQTQEMPDYQPESVWSKVVSRPDESSIVDPELSAAEPEAEAKKFSLSDSALLELPGRQPFPAISTSVAPASSASNQVTSLSPELIDLIVEKVIEKLSGKKA
ncbi:MAG: response regulator [Acidobacteriota bacterium]